MGELWSDPSAVLWATFSVNYVLGGFAPAGYHAVNLAIHIAASLLILGIVRRTLLSERLGGRFDGAATALAGSAALLWVVHPLGTQAVTYIIQRRESLMGMFYLLTVYLAIRGFGSPTRRWWLMGAVVACWVGMRCKPVMVTAPVIVLLYDWMFIDRKLTSILRRRWLFYAALALSWILLAPNTSRLADRGMGMAHLDLSMWDYAMTQFGVILRYLSLSFWPAGQCLEYQWPVARTASRIVAPAIVICSLVALTLWGLIRRRPSGFIGAWFFVILAPTSSFVVIAIPIFEHRMYLSLAAVIVLVVVGGFVVGSKICARWSISPSRSGPATLVLVGVIATALTAATINRNTRYYSALWMWADVLESCPDSVHGNYNYAVQLERAGELDRAIEHYRKATELLPRFAQAHNNLGLLLAGKGRLNEAIEHYRRAIETHPEMVSVHHNLGLALQAGNLLDQAAESYRQALSLRPDHPGVHNSLGALHYRRGQYAAAADEYRLALKSDSALVDAMSNLAWLLSACPDDKLRDGPQAVKLATKACSATEYNRPGLIAVLSVAYAECGQFDRAVQAAHAARKLIAPGTRVQTSQLLDRLIRCYRERRPWRDSAPE